MKSLKKLLKKFFKKVVQKLADRFQISDPRALLAVHKVSNLKIVFGSFFTVQAVCVGDLFW